MSSFDDRLFRVLSEMPVRHFKAAGDRAPSRSYFKGKSYEGYTSPKYMEVVSDKLSRLSGYNINIFVIDGKEHSFDDYTFGFMGYKSGQNRLRELSEVTGLPVSEFSDAITFIMSGNSDQVEFSPWLYMHQLAEAISIRFGFLESADDGWVFQEFYDRIEELVPDWVYRLKMGSAREAKRKGRDINDLHQELITEFLWHGGRVRFDYPDDVERREVDAVFDIFKTVLRGVLDALVGDVLVNDFG